MVMKIKFTIFGEPQGKGRARVVKQGNFAKAYTPEKTVVYENLVKMEYQRQCGNKRFSDDDMLQLIVFAYYGIPKSTNNKKRELMLQNEIRPTKKPDWDNIGKIISDSLNKIAYHDDAQIVSAHVIKLYSTEPRVVVVIRKINESEEKNI